MKYKEWLKIMKGYTEKTIEIYTKYAFELEENKRNYETMMRKYIGKSNATLRLVLSSIKSYYIYLSDPRANDITLPKKRITISNYVTFQQYQEYIKGVNNKTKTGFQKYIIIRILFETGIRSSEILLLTKENIVDNKIKIFGKGNKERFVLVSKWLKHDIEEYIYAIKTTRLFPFSYKNLYQKIQRLDKNRNLTPHMFRHGFAKYCNKMGISIYDISLSMGHSNIDTTAKYINKKSDDVLIHTIF